MVLLAALAQLLDCTFLLIAHVSGRTSFPKPLSPDAERSAIARMEAGDPAAARELIEDLVSIGSIGLIKAVNSFRPEAGKLTAYAARCVENEILMALRAGRKLKANLSMNEPIGSDKEGNEIMLADILGTDPDLVPSQAETNIESARVLAPREKTVIVLRYGLIDGHPRPQHQVAKALGISRSYVSRIEKKALGKLREAMKPAFRP